MQEKSSQEKERRKIQMCGNIFFLYRTMITVTDLCTVWLVTLLTCVNVQGVGGHQERKLPVGLLNCGSVGCLYDNICMIAYIHEFKKFACLINLLGPVQFEAPIA